MERAAWTDHRLDDFARQVDKRFDHVDARFDQVDRRFDRLENQVDALRTTFVRVGGGLMVGLLGVIATLLARGG